MIKKTGLSEHLITGRGGHKYGPRVDVCTLKGIDEIQYLEVTPHTSIKMHRHNTQWEVWLRVSHQKAYVCLKGEEHELVNNSGAKMVIMAIKGHINYSYDDLAELFWRWGFSVYHGSLVVNED